MADVDQQPLLSKRVQQQERGVNDEDDASIIGRTTCFTEGCPGCAVEFRKMSREGLPAKELSFLAVITLANCLAISSLFPFLYFMVEDFHVTNSITDIAFYAGFIGSAFMVGRFVSSSVWGIIADKYGRKPVMVCGTASMLILNSLFGFSTTFWMALTSRFLLGIFNGLLGAIRAYVSEICTEDQQAFGMSMVGTIWGLGLVIGPAIGGYFSQPSSKYPNLFPYGSIFDKFPYALPCLLISMFAAFGLVFSIMIPETLHKHPTQLVPKSMKESNDSHLAVSKELKSKSLFRNWGFISSVILYCIWSLHDLAYVEIFSLWAVSPRTLWGLGLTSSDVGIILAISGGALLIFQMLLYPIIQKYCGLIRTCRLAAILSGVLVVVYPLFAMLHGSLLWAVVTLASCAKNILNVAVMTASFILINNSVTMDQRGVANGISMSFISLCKAVGPASAGILLSWSETRLDASFLPGTWMVFSIMALLCGLTVLFTVYPILPRHLNHPKVEISRVENLRGERQPCV